MSRNSKSISHHHLDHLAALLSQALPFRSSPGQIAKWTEPGGRTAMLAWTNEPIGENGPLLELTDQGSAVIGTTGYFTETGSLQTFAKCVKERRTPGGGCYSVFLAGADGVEALTTLTRIDPVYFCETADFVLIGSRALLVHLASHVGKKPEYDMDALVGFVNTGFMVDDRTPFKGVAAAPGATVVSGSRAGVRLVDVDRDVSEVEEPLGFVADRVANALITAVGPVVKRGGALRVSLTGGKDSRLVAAALGRTGVAFETHTVGLASDPDVVVAAEVARTLGVGHTFSSPSGLEVAETGRQAVDLAGRLRNCVLVSEGMLSAYENFASFDSRYETGKVVLGGQGGELLRGGYAKIVGSESVEQCVDYLRKGLLERRRKLLTDERAKKYGEYVQSWVERTMISPSAGLDEFYLNYRAGRWSAVARSANSIRNMLCQPLFDEAVIRAARLVDVKTRYQEILAHAVLERLEPRLAKVRFEARRWKFEENGPSDRERMVDWQARAPVKGKRGRGMWNWRTGYGQSLASALRDSVLDHGKASELFGLVDRTEVENLLKRQEIDAHGVWILATLATLLSGDWMSGGSESGPLVAVLE